MIRKRGTGKKTRWTVEVYNARTPDRKLWVGSFLSQKEARDAEAKARVRTSKKARLSETVGVFASRWADDYPRPKESTRLHNKERVQKFGEAFSRVALHNLSRSDARQWVLQHPATRPALHAMFE